MHTPDDNEETPEDQNGLEYSTLEDWVENWLTYVYDQSITSTSAWCSRWWDHPGAYVRLQAMWETWEASRQKPGEMANWFLHIADPMMKEITRADGTFYGCKDRSIGEYAARWVIQEDTLIEVRQQPPTITRDNDGQIIVATPNIEGVEYRQETNPEGKIIISAVPKPGYQLHTGHRVDRPHTNGQLPTEKSPALPTLPYE